MQDSWTFVQLNPIRLCSIFIVFVVVPLTERTSGLLQRGRRAQVTKREPALWRTL
jgi:hypothetical protein